MLLSRIDGLDTVRHYRPSYVDLQSLLRAPDPTYLFSFYWVSPDIAIEYLPSLQTQPIQFFSCFISYSSADEPFAERLYGDLQARHIRCWFAPEHLKIGDRIRDVVDRSIHLHEKLLVVLSADSIKSDWVQSEVEAAFEKERKTKAGVLFPVRIDDAVMTTDNAWASDLRRQRHIGDFTDWQDEKSYASAFARVLRDLKAEGLGTVQTSGPDLTDLPEDIPF